MTLQQLAELGYVCGLDTLGEAVSCVHSHWDAYPPGTLEALHAEITRAEENEIGRDMLCVHYLGIARCAQIDAEMDAYFNERARVEDRAEFDWQ